MQVGDLVRLGMRHREFGITVFSDRYGIIMDFDDCDLYDILCDDGETYVYSKEELEVVK